MADPKFWGELSEQEQAEFAKKVVESKAQGWEELARLAEESGIEPDEDTLPTIYELEHWSGPGPVERKGDQLFAYAVNGEKCPHCNWPQSNLYVLARDQFEADAIRRNGGGLCGQCQCDNIRETHGEVVTQKAYINTAAVNSS